MVRRSLMQHTFISCPTPATTTRGTVSPFAKMRTGCSIKVFGRLIKTSDDAGGPLGVQGGVPRFTRSRRRGIASRRVASRWAAVETRGSNSALPRLRLRVKQRRKFKKGDVVCVDSPSNAIPKCKHRSKRIKPVFRSHRRTSSGDLRNQSCRHCERASHECWS